MTRPEIVTPRQPRLHPSKETDMVRQIIRVEPLSTWLARGKAPTPDRLEAARPSSL